jgi:TPP-dependent 2-oxoacid decarboxylase
MDLHLDVRVIERAQGPWASIGYLLGLALGSAVALVAIAALFGFGPMPV